MGAPRWWWWDPGRRSARLAWGVAGAIPVVMVVRDCLADWVYCSGVSMQPTLNPYPDEATLRRYYFSRSWRDVVLVEKVSARSGRFTRGSVVLLRSAEAPERFLMKRLIGISGDWVVNREGEYVHVPKGHCWVEGDNQEHSIDSNKFGAVPLALIVGVAALVCWPPWRIAPVATRDEQHEHARVRRRPFQAVEVAEETPVAESSVALTNANGNNGDDDDLRVLDEQGIDMDTLRHFDISDDDKKELLQAIRSSRVRRGDSTSTTTE